ncbi:MAG: DUF2786 domain-containing protein [Pirellulaceae bacterium]
MEFVWHDGGRSAAGFVGSAGDCVVRALSIGTGNSYRSIYDRLKDAAGTSPRRGIPMVAVREYLSELSWDQHIVGDMPLVDVDLACSLPKGVVIAHLSKPNDRCQHLTTFVDRTVHDTWNPVEDNYILREYWTPPANSGSTSTTDLSTEAQPQSLENQTTQKEFERVMRVLRALDRTANNQASTEAEKRNALRAMQHMMLQNNLSREDVQEENTDQVHFTRICCAVNSNRACQWEKGLAAYLCDYIVTSVQWYVSRSGHRTLFAFYGPRDDVKVTVGLFRELLLSITASARLNYGGHARGSGASYAEGYVAGLPRFTFDTAKNPSDAKTQSDALVATSRALVLHKAGREWLAKECHIRLVHTSSAGRSKHDPSAGERGRSHGAQHKIDRPNQQKRLN